MAMGTRKDRERQEDLWVAYTDMAVGPGHPFYVRLNEVLDGEGFDALVEKLCARFYADRLGRPGLTPGIYFRSLMIGYFEGIESERGIAWRLKDSLSHSCPATSRTDSTGCKYRLGCYCSPSPEVPVKWAFSRIELG
jgi:transposase